MATVSSNKNVTADFEVVTPEMADKWLTESNKMNRPIRLRRLDMYADAMTEHEFESLNGQTITFDDAGVLTDGQHRLAAIRASGIAQEMLVVRGVTTTSRSTVDDGAKRVFSDDLAMNGIVNSTVKAALFKKILVWDTYGGLESWQNVRWTRKHMALRWGLYQEQVENSEFEARRFAARWSMVGNVGAMQFMYWLLRYRIGCDERAVNRFFSIIAIGSQDPADEVLIKLRENLLKSITISPTGVKRYSPAHEEVWWLIRAWNAWLAGTKFAFITPRNGFTDPFPTPVLATAGESK